MTAKTKTGKSIGADSADASSAPDLHAVPIKTRAEVVRP
jgi:hypothetical protein